MRFSKDESHFFMFLVTCSIFSSNDRVGISTEASQDEVFLCDNIHDLIFLVLRNQVDISFSATKDRHGHGFKASYVSVQDVFTGTNSAFY